MRVISRIVPMPMMGRPRADLGSARSMFEMTVPLNDSGVLCGIQGREGNRREKRKERRQYDDHPYYVAS